MAERRQGAEPFGTIAGRRDQQIAEIGTEPIRASEKLAAVHDAEPDGVLDGDDQEIAETATVPEPVLGLGDEVDVAVDCHGHAEPLCEVVAEP